MSKLTQARERIAALETREVHVLDGDGEEPWVQYKAIKLDEALAIIDGLIADDLAMLEPTPDARELAEEIVDYVSEEEYGAIAFAAHLIAAHDARLLDEAAERGVEAEYPSDALLPCDNEEIEKVERRKDRLRAAIKGAAHE